MTFDNLSVRTQNCLKAAGFTDFMTMKSMGADRLRERLIHQPHFGIKSWNEIQEVLKWIPAPWFEFAL